MEVGNIHQVCHNQVLEQVDILFMLVHFMDMETFIYQQQKYLINFFFQKISILYRYEKNIGVYDNINY